MLVVLSLLETSVSHAQSLVPALLQSPLEIGSGYTLARSSYTADQLMGPSIYANLNVRHHFAVVTTFSHLGTANKGATEDTGTIGFRAHTAFRALVPFVLVAAGPAIIQEPISRTSENASSITIGGSAGTELALPKHFAVRAQYEYQRWLSITTFPGLTAHLETFSLSYRIPPNFGRQPE